jgi:wobble nucleotide-excising tRNase
MNTNKKHKLKKEAEDKLREYLNQYEEDIKNRINTEQENEQRRSNTI